jgi:hypothetical protein
MTLGDTRSLWHHDGGIRTHGKARRRGRARADKQAAAISGLKSDRCAGGPRRRNRTVSCKIVLNEPLWPHFTNKTALAEFWAKPAAERQTIWGAPIDPTIALAEFEERFLPHAKLR